ncbi:hypothetical protein U1Q18_004832 [Sarracenia purpurea var. burkii]
MIQSPPIFRARNDNGVGIYIAKQNKTKPNGTKGLGSTAQGAGIRRTIAKIADSDLDINLTVGAGGGALQIQLAGGALAEVGIVDDVTEGETGRSDEWRDVGAADAGVDDVDVEGP